MTSPGIHVWKPDWRGIRTGVFKTLVLKGGGRGYLVCCIPVAEELDF